MLFEYAIDPKVITDLESLTLIANNFGVPHGRLISRFPKQWKKMVNDACAAQPDRERSRIEEILRNMANKKTIIASGRQYDANQTWLENAEQQQSIKKFHAIIANDNPNECKDVLIYSTIRTELEEDIPLFKVQRNQSIQRTPKALAISVLILMNMF